MADERAIQLLQEGQAAAQRGDNAVARDYLAAAVDLDPDNADAWLWLAGVQEKPTEAEAALQRVLTLEPDNAYARQGLAEIEAQLALWDDTQAAASPAVAAFPVPVADDVPTEQAVATLSIEEELRAALNAPESAGAPSGASSRRGGASATGVMQATDGRRGRLVAGHDDGVYRVMVVMLGMILVVGMVWFTLLMAGIGPVAAITQ